MSPAAFPAEKNERQAEYFSNRLQKNEKMLRKWARSKDIGAFRLYDVDIPEVPLAVDLYREEGGDEKGRALVIALYERPYEKDEAEEAAWLGLMAAAASEALSVDPRRIFLKTRKRMKGLSQYGRQGEESAEAIIREAGLRFRVNFSDYLDTGDRRAETRPQSLLVYGLVLGIRGGGRRSLGHLGRPLEYLPRLGQGEFQTQRLPRKRPPCGESRRDGVPRTFPPRGNPMGHHRGRSAHLLQLRHGQG